jgi:hypothetical protein
MKKLFSTAACAAIAALALTSVAQAKHIDLSVNASASTINIVVSALSGLATGSSVASFTGLQPAQGLDGDLQDIGGDPSQLTIANNPGQGAFLSNTSINVGGGLAVASLTNVHATIGSGGPFAGSGGGADNSDFDLGGTGLTLDNGVLVANVPLFGIATTLDFFVAPASFTLPPATIANAKLGAGPPTNQPVTLTIPVNIVTALTSGTATIATVTLNGSIVLTGIRIPEPGTFALLGLGLMGLVPILRNRLRK